MGIGARAIDLLIKLRSGGYLGPGTKVMEIGAQQLSNTFLSYTNGLASVRQAFGVTQDLSLPPPKPTLILNDAETLDPAAPYARDFWHWLGFDYASIDIDGSPNSIPLDLNYDSAPAEAKGKYGLVTNYGTTEHIANQLNAFRVIHDLTRPG